MEWIGWLTRSLDVARRLTVPPPPCKAFIGLVGRLLRPPPGYRQDGQRAGADAPSKAFIGPKNELGGYKLARFFFQ